MSDGFGCLRMKLVNPNHGGNKMFSRTWKSRHLRLQEKESNQVIRCDMWELRTRLRGANGVDHHDRERRLLLFCARRRRARHGIPVGHRGDEFVRTGDQSSAHPTLDHDRGSVPVGDILIRETSAAAGCAAPLGLPRQRCQPGSRRGSS